MTKGFVWIQKRKDMDSPFTLDVPSSGYLEDAIAGWSNQCNLRQTVTCSDDYYMWQNEGNLDDEVDHFLGFTSLETNSLADGYYSNSSKIPWIPAETSTRGIEQKEIHSPSCPLQTCMAFMDSIAKDASISKDYGVKTIAYPFDMIKRGGIEGHVTLEDINYRMLKRPTRVVRHPVGNFATRSSISNGGFGVSGKIVVALTKIHTRGSGTVTVIRTKS